MLETSVWPLGREDPWSRKWQPTSIFLPGKSHGQRSLVDYGPWDHKELDMTAIEHTQKRLRFPRVEFLLEWFLPWELTLQDISFAWQQSSTRLPLYSEDLQGWDDGSLDTASWTQVLPPTSSCIPKFGHFQFLPSVASAHPSSAVHQITESFQKQKLGSALC